MNQLMKDVVDGVTAQLASYGVAPETQRHYKVDLCGPIIKLCVKECNGYYCKDVLERYRENFRARHERGEISYLYFVNVDRVVRLLTSFAETGVVDFSRRARKRKYIPSPENEQIVWKTLNANKVTSMGPRRDLGAVMRHFFCFIEQQGIELSAVTTDTFFHFMEDISSTHKGSMDTAFRALKYLSAYLKENHLAEIKLNLSLLSARGRASHIIPSFTHEEIEKIVSSIDTTTPFGKRDLAIILLAFNTGLRASDIAHLRFGDIDWKKGIVSVIQKKTATPVTLPLNNVVMNALADYILKARPECEFREIFLVLTLPIRKFSRPNVLNGILEKYRKLAGIPKKPGRAFHSLRRSFATELSVEGVPIGTISEMMGHKSLQSDKQYLSYDTNHISLCAADFSDVPIVAGIYAKYFISKQEGGICDAPL